MNLINQLRTRFLKTRLFKTLIDNYAALPETEIIKKDSVSDIVHSELEKVNIMQRNEAMRYRVPYNINTNTNPDRKPNADVPFSYLRRMAVLYPIARACINRRIRQITQLDWEISTVDEVENEDGYKEQISKVTEFLKRPMGQKSRMRELLTMMVDDVLTVDAICIEISKLRGGDFDLNRGLIPVDPTTIALRVEDSGATPQPPEIAYAQIIQGTVVAQFTTDELLYEMMGSRSYSPYGLAPLESLILQCESALRGTLYNLNYLRESNVPEGFITLPDDVAQSKDQVEEWQTWFDGIMAGDAQMMHRLKILPGGAEYTAAKKPEDMSFERFEIWLLQQTCAMFDVQPQDIGITYQVNKSTGDTQADLSRERGLIPLANFLKEIFDDLIQVDMQMPNLQLKWLNLNPVDRKEEVEIAIQEINAGALSVDEYRINQGLEPIGLDNYIKTTGMPILVKDFLTGNIPGQTTDANGNSQKPNENADNGDSETEQDKSEQKEIKAWRKCIYTDLELNRPLRTTFKAEYIKDDNYSLIKEGLKAVHNRHQAKLLFDQFLDADVRSSMKLLRIGENMRRIENANFSEE